MRIVIGSDHAGFELKEAVKAFLIEENRDVLDVGTYSKDPVDYPDYAEAVGTALRERRAERGIILCGSGVGASMAANRIPGIRAGLCHDTYSAHQGVEHDGMNVLVLGGRVVGIELARELIRAFLNASFTGEGRHLRRLAKMTAMENRLRALQVFGQSVWLDYIRRSLITSGELHRLIDEDGLRGVTSHPAIFEKAVAGSSDYKEILESPETRALDAKTLYENLAVSDIQHAADALRPVYEETLKRDGYVCLEVSPFLAHDTAGTMDEARRLWQTVGRDNLMIKIPATQQGIPAIHQLISEGINVNVTLLFAQEAYEQVAEAYIAGLEKFATRGGDLERVASVASFFISRIDSAIDGLITARLQVTTNAREQNLLRGLTGKVAIANAKLVYQRYQELFSDRRWQELAGQGAQAQRLLWASTSTKNPSYRDVAYVEELIGPDTVTTIPPATFGAFRNHGRPRASLTEDVDSACDTMRMLAEVGISMKDVTDKLLAEGVQLFSDAFDKLLKAVKKQSKEAGEGKINRLTYKLPDPLADAVKASLAEWHAQGKVRRLWGRDASLWTGRDEAQWLGWLGIPNGQLAHIQRLARITEVAKSARFSHVLLLGMGGSSLCPEVMKTTFGTIRGFPELHVLDSTDPAQVKTFENKIDLKNTLFIVSSKSGSTLEPNIFKQYFFDRVMQLVGMKEAGRRFITITDPGSKMQQVAEIDGFRHVFFGWANIGGRYSALSDFGLVPAAIMGVDVAKFLDRTEEMVYACMPSVPVEENPGVILGTILGVAANQFGRDKVTIITSPGIYDLGAWLEQMVAGSTGKEGKGLIPIDRESPGKPDVYDRDRIFVYLRLLSAPDAAQDRFIEDLEHAGLPVVHIVVDDPYNLGEEFFRWEIATAVAGSILGINPFDQPDVEASKASTRKLTAEYERNGTLPEEIPIFTGEGIKLFTDEKNAGALAKMVNDNPTLAGYLKAHLNRLSAGDYFALLAYIEMNEAHERKLQAIRHLVRDTMRVATCLQFGPRFLHSTGQVYKGGPNTGVFLQITCNDAIDLPVPGQKYTFGIVKAAQARGDFQVLAERNRRVLRVHLEADVGAGLTTLQKAITAALMS
ncbi:MAG: bifunctional transaldolase/phosoglucose isomerase [Candidatus Jettenia ecosi]|uniref:Transaldolase n=1 Tax=Candidatus Jettenia ecosi TaxID=2494326 RepID=A0A533QG90_9BACT|nr:MAG: bifunctional transaldolase/phosoglucose isomerase [Candidatus Jettenia ecosi]